MDTPSTPGVDTADVVVLGAGSADYATALRSAQLGLRVTLVEKSAIGGTCLHSGCIPTKALLHVAEVADEVRSASALGVNAELAGIDGGAVLAYKNTIVEKLHRGLEGLVHSSETITVVSGTGVLVDPHTVSVDEATYRGKSIVLATGSRTRHLPGIEIGGRVLTSTEALALDHVPGSVVIVGGSVIGVEFASAWRSLGAEVTIVEAQDSLVPLEDPVLSSQLTRAFRRRKIVSRTGVGVAGVEQSAEQATVVLDDGSRIDADYVLIAIGRAPASDGIGLEEAGVSTENGWVRTDARLRTSVDSVYAIGDLVAGLQLAHRGFAHGIFVAEELAGLAPTPVVDTAIPRVTYCQPELASVGLTEHQARESFPREEITTVEYHLAGNGKSTILGTQGQIKLVADASGRILGVHMIGARISEQIGEAALMVNLDVSAEELARNIHAHPTQNEALGEALLMLAGKPLHAHT